MGIAYRVSGNDRDIFPRDSGVCRETDRSRKAHASGKNRRYVVLFCAKHQTLSIAGNSRERGQIQGKARCCSWPESGFDGKEGEPFFVGQVESQGCLDKARHKKGFCFGIGQGVLRIVSYKVSCFV